MTLNLSKIFSSVFLSILILLTPSIAYVIKNFNTKTHARELTEKKTEDVRYQENGWKEDDIDKKNIIHRPQTEKLGIFDSYSLRFYCRVAGILGEPNNKCFVVKATDNALSHTAEKNQNSPPINEIKNLKLLVNNLQSQIATFSENITKQELLNIELKAKIDTLNNDIKKIDNSNLQKETKVITKNNIIYVDRPVLDAATIDTKYLEVMKFTATSAIISDAYIKRLSVDNLVNYGKSELGDIEAKGDIVNSGKLFTEQICIGKVCFDEASAIKINNYLNQ